jgi:hypothetical protein
MACLAAWGVRYLLFTPVGDVAEDHRAALYPLRAELVQRFERYMPKRIMKVRLVLFPEEEHPEQVGRVTGIEAEGISIFSGGDLYRGLLSEVKLGTTLARGDHICFVADLSTSPPSAIDIRRC